MIVLVRFYFGDDDCQEEVGEALPNGHHNYRVKGGRLLFRSCSSTDTLNNCGCSTEILV
jgi:hypothetical protein